MCSLVDGFAVVDSLGIIQQVNASLIDMIGVEEKSLVGKNYTILFSDTRNPLEGEYKFAFVEKEFLQIDDTRLYVGSDNEIPVDLTISTIMDAHGNPNGILFLVKDIRLAKQLADDRAKAEKKLKETQDELIKTEKMAVICLAQ